MISDTGQDAKIQLDVDLFYYWRTIHVCNFCDFSQVWFCFIDLLWFCFGALVVSLSQCGSVLSTGVFFRDF